MPWLGRRLGALNAAFLAGHCDLAGVEALGDLWVSIRRGDVFPFSAGSLLRIVTGNQRFVVDPLGLRNLLARANLGFERLEEAPIPPRVVATDLETGEPVVLREGDIVPALLASSAIPGVFPTVHIGGRTLVDGAMVPNTPVGQAEELNPLTHLCALHNARPCLGGSGERACDTTESYGPGIQAGRASGPC